MPAFSLLIAPARPHGGPSMHTERSLTAPPIAWWNPKLRLYVWASLDFRRANPRLVSCYAFFKGWLLLSRPPRCFRINTSFATKHTIWDLSCWSGLFSFCSWNLAPRCWVLRNINGVFGVWLDTEVLSPDARSVLYPPTTSRNPIPKYISGRTSYLRVRLAYYLLPQLIRASCSIQRCGPPPRYYQGFILVMVSSPGFGSFNNYIFALFTLAFTTASTRNVLT